MKLIIKFTLSVSTMIAVTCPMVLPSLAKGGGHPVHHAAPHHAAPHHAAPRPHPAAQHQAQAQGRARQMQANRQQAQQRQAQAGRERQAQANQQRQAQASQQRQAQVQRQAQANQHHQMFERNHPGRAEVLRRDAHLNNALNQDKGDLNGHFYQLKNRDASIRHQEQFDAAHNGGHLTGQEYRQLNHEENGLRRQVSRDNSGAGDAQFQRNHPLRTEVLGRDSNLNRSINQDKGDLGGHYNQLRRQDTAIQHQEQYDAAHNGGHLTGQEYRQINGEENGLRNRISRDNNGVGDAQFQKNHPLRSEVLGRDSNLSNTLNQDKGNLSGQYYQLRNQNAAIRRQEQYDAAHNGGHLSGQEYQSLNNEENNLRQQVYKDNHQ